MGSCLGHCRLARESFRWEMKRFRCNCLYKFYSKANDSVDIHINDFANTVSEEHLLNLSPALNDSNEIPEDSFECEPKKLHFGRLKSIFSNIRKKNYDSSVLRLELLDDEWSVTEGENSARTESLVIPSSAKIKGEKTQNSTSLNSLDLEWEHLPEMTVFSTNVEKEEPQSATSAEGWSRFSSADSLEWDSAEVEMKEEMDTETEQLIQEIEMLSLRTLQETQGWAS